MFLGLLVPNLLVRIRIWIRFRIRILLSSSINSKKHWFLLFCDFFYDILSLKNNVNVPSKSNKQKTFHNIFDVLKFTDVKGKIRISIRIWIRIHKSEVWIRGSRSASGSVPKFPGSETLLSVIFLKFILNVSAKQAVHGKGQIHLNNSVYFAMLTLALNTSSSSIIY